MLGKLEAGGFGTGNEKIKCKHKIGTGLKVKWHEGLLGDAALKLRTPGLKKRAEGGDFSPLLPWGESFD